MRFWAVVCKFSVVAFSMVSFAVLLYLMLFGSMCRCAFRFRHIHLVGHWVNKRWFYFVKMSVRVCECSAWMKCVVCLHGLVCFGKLSVRSIHLMNKTQNHSNHFANYSHQEWKMMFQMHDNNEAWIYGIKMERNGTVHVL